MKQLRNEHGYIALISLLLIGAASLATGLALLTTGIDSQKSSLMLQQSIQARQLASACAEEALQVMHDNTAATGTNSMSLDQGTCAYTITSTGSSTRTIDASGTVNDVVRKAKVYVTIGGSSISITSWQEVSDA